MAEFRFPVIKIRDRQNGNVRFLGSNCHDQLVVDEDTGGLQFLNLRSGEGTGSESDYEFVQQDSNIGIDFVSIEELMSIYQQNSPE
jgi:hypothetical protein